MEKYIGRLLDGRYEILSIIGFGGMAFVYKAMDHRLNRLVAVKILRDEYTNDPDFRRRFHNESQAAAMMSHPNIVSVYDVSKNDDLDYIVMELIDGISLKEYMEQKKTLSWRETLHFSMQIAKALEHAHSRNIIHRDIKPHNVMILKDGSVKVADFGIARIASASNTLTKEALGSVHYISPEQAKGARVDPRTDIYSLGVVMYEMLTGRTPYDGETPVSVAIQHINGTPLSPSLLNSDIPIGLEQITMHAMCSDLNIRYASISDMLADMEEFRKNPSIQFTFLPVNAQNGGSSAVRVQQGRSQTNQGQNGKTGKKQINRDPEQEREERNRRIILTIAIALAALALIGIVILIFKNNSAEEPPASTEASRTASTEQQIYYMPQLVSSLWGDIPEDSYPYLQMVVNERSWVYNKEFPEGVICDQSIPAGEPVSPGTEVFLYISLGEKTDSMPDLENFSLDNARSILSNLDIELNILTDSEYSSTVKTGNVTRTEPAAGSVLKNGQYITIFTSLGPETNMVQVPAVTGAAATNAIVALEAKHLRHDTTEAFSSTVAAGYVISQDPPAYSEVEEDTVIHLVVSKGKETVTMVSVIGETEAYARQVLENLSLRVEVIYDYSTTSPQGTVIQQSYAAGLELYPESNVVLTVSLGPKPIVPPTTEPPVTEPPPTEPPVTESSPTEPTPTEPPPTEPTVPEPDEPEPSESAPATPDD